MSTTPEKPTVAGQQPRTLVPESWPPVDPIEPVKTVRVHWLLALPATIAAAFFPRRLGPHLASSSWTAAYVAHFLSAWIAVGAVFAFVFEHGIGDREYIEFTLAVNPLVELRRALAGTVLLTLGMFNRLPQFFGVAVVAALIEAVVWIGPLALTPLYAAGEGRRRTYLRGVKLLLWSSGCQIPIFWLFARLIERFELDRYDYWAPVSLLGLQLWYLTVVIRLGGRYGGPNDGPRWQERQPRCEACGYSLVSLPLDGRCPECGESVANSLPERRRPPAFAAARGLPARFVGFFRTTWQALFARSFARGVTVWGHHRAARNYAALMCVLVGVTSAAVSLAFQRLETSTSVALWEALLPQEQSVEEYLDTHEYVAASVLVGIGGGLSVLAWMLLVGLFLSRFGLRDMADRVVILCYSTAWLLLPLSLGIAGGWSAHAIIERWGPFSGFRVPEVGWVEWEVTLWLALLVPCATALLHSFLRMRTVLGHARFANA